MVRWTHINVPSICHISYLVIILSLIVLNYGQIFVSVAESRLNIGSRQWLSVHANHYCLRNSQPLTCSPCVAVLVLTSTLTAATKGNYSHERPGCYRRISRQFWSSWLNPGFNFAMPLNRPSGVQKFSKNLKILNILVIRRVAWSSILRSYKHRAQPY